MTERRHLLRLELAVCALGVTVLLTTLVIGIDALRFHRATLDERWFSPVSVPLAAILALEGLALVLMGSVLGAAGRRLGRARAPLPRASRERVLNGAARRRCSRSLVETGLGKSLRQIEVSVSTGAWTNAGARVDRWTSGVTCHGGVRSTQS